MASKATYPDLTGKTFVVTGAASGMGRSIALQLAAQGSNLGLLDLQAPDTVAEEVKKLGVKGVPLACNVEDGAAVDAAIQDVRNRLGRLDGAANMAGISGLVSLGDTSNALDTLLDANWDKVLKTNLDGVKNCLRSEIRIMKKDGTAGSIINASSIAGQVGHPYSSPYAASKWGVIGLTKSAAQEGGPVGIRVNAIAPGVVQSPFNHAMGTREDWDKAMGSHIGLKRMAEPEEITKVILFLLSEEASYMSGSVVNVDGAYM